MSFFPDNNSTNRNSYRINLSSLMGLCANNYLLLIKLLADNILAGDKRSFFISEKIIYSITIEEVTKYTSLIHFTQTANVQSDKPKTTIRDDVAQSLLPTMVIRLYHDAKVAEVISTQNIKQIKPRYDYPNKKMHQQNEKQQTNQFLHDWLKLCLEFGQVKLEPLWKN